MNNLKMSLLVAFVCAVVGIASPEPAIAAGDGPFYTPITAFTDGKVGRYYFTVPGVVKKNDFTTEFLCTNLDSPGTSSDIGVEVFDNTGTQLNSVSTPPSTNCNGAVLNVAAGSTVTIATGGTSQMHEDCKMGMLSFDNGSARIVTTGGKIACSAFIIDSKNIVDVTTGASPSGVSLKIVKGNKQRGE